MWASDRLMGQVSPVPRPQHSMPADEYKMSPRPIYEQPEWTPTGLLEGRRAVISGGDSGIGRAVAWLFACEGADVVIGYLNEEIDALETRAAIEKLGRACTIVRGDLARPSDAEALIAAATETYGIDVLVSNAAIQYEADSFEAESPEHIAMTVDVNLKGSLYLVRAALPHMNPGASILVTASVTAYRGSEHLVSYASTKGGLVALVRSLAPQLASNGIRVNGVAPGPVWTPLIAGSFDEQDIAEFGKDNPMGRAAQPYEIAPSYLFLASERWSGFVSGQVVHPNGGETVNA